MLEPQGDSSINLWNVRRCTLARMDAIVQLLSKFPVWLLLILSSLSVITGDFFAKYWSTMPEELVEPEVRGIIETLQARPIPTVALTSFDHNNFSKFAKDPIQWRIDRLKKQGIQFSWPSLKHRAKWTDEISFQDGVIFAGDAPKGDALARFFQEAQWMPSVVVVIDDHRAKIESVQQVCASLGISSVGFLYRAAVFNNDPEPNEGAIRAQIERLGESTETP